LFDPEKLPAFHDPFAGGGAIPLEAQRLGLEAYASDLNPVAVLINKAMIEIPPKFAGRAPIGPVPEGTQFKEKCEGGWTGAKGLAEDVRRYGHWMREEAKKRIGHLYPPVEISNEMVEDPENPRPDLKKYVGRKLTVIAWLWARTVKSPNPAFREVDVPLASSFILSTKVGKEAYVEPVIEGGGYRFLVKVGKPKDAKGTKTGTKLARGAKFFCLMSSTPIEGDYIKAEGKAGRMSERLMAIVAKGDHGRVYLRPISEHETVAQSIKPTWRPETPLPDDLRNFWTLNYGLTKFSDLFTPRQLVGLTTLSDLVPEVIKKIKQDSLLEFDSDGNSLEQGGTGQAAYAEALAVYISLSLGKLSDNASTICTWHSGAQHQKIRATFSRQSIPMTWDFAEGNIFSESTGNFLKQINILSEVIEKSLCGQIKCHCSNCNAYTQMLSFKIISTDPPYYDNISYSDLSDFFYIWLRRSLKLVYPALFSTLNTPKSEELIASPYRHGNKDLAESFFLKGMTKAMSCLNTEAHPSFPVSIYYAFKQTEIKIDGSLASTGWETFLDAVLTAGFSITGTWPMRTELGNRMIGKNTNALASSIVLVCRQRRRSAPQVSRGEFMRELKAALPKALKVMVGGKKGSSPIAPVDLAQAAIGPGMAVFTKYAAVLEADGSPMTVRTALTLINKAIDQYFEEAEGELDPDTRFCLGWFAECGWKADLFGKATVLAQAKVTSVDGLRHAGVVEAEAGKVRLLRPAEYPAKWNPQTDTHNPIWESLHHLVRALKQDGEEAAGSLLALMADRAEPVRQLAYRLYTLCERKGWAEDARLLLRFNALR